MTSERAVLFPPSEKDFRTARHVSCGAPDSREPLSTSQEHPVIDIDPNSSGLPGIEHLRIIVGAVMTV
ncbi:MAG: hypothetical protein L0L18_13965, partial [Acidipropionibacterium jensenii]|nr:hypothetical protein [Acidipropionibacterium jensenii]